MNMAWTDTDTYMLASDSSRYTTSVDAEDYWRPGQGRSTGGRRGIFYRRLGVALDV